MPSEARGLEAPTKTAALPWWVLALVIVCAVLMALGAIVALVDPAMLAGSGEAINGAVRVYAGYLVSRNFAIAGMLIALLRIGSRRGLVSVTVLAGLVQIADAGMDCFEGRWQIVPGVLVLGILLLLAARRIASRI